MTLDNYVPIASEAGADLSMSPVTTVIVAVVPGCTAHTPLGPLGVGTVNTICVFDQLSIWNAAAFPGAPQLTDPSTNCR